MKHLKISAIWQKFVNNFKTLNMKIETRPEIGIIVHNNVT